jgi:hypothetical protein
MKNNYGTTWEDRFGEGCFGLTDERLWPTFFKQYNKKVLEYAEIAEKYGVELFAPMHEQDGVIGLWILHDRGSFSGYNKASEWGQEILPGIKERYHGKLVWEGAFNNGRLVPPEQYRRVLDELYINFTGYDYIGFTTSPTFAPEEGPEEYRECVRCTIDTLSKWAERDGCEGVIAAEMTLAYAVTSTGWKDFLANDIVFEEGEGKLSGYIPGFGSESWEKEGLKHWYKEKLP